jgi:hypothetical protein
VVLVKGKERKEEIVKAYFALELVGIRSPG